MQAGKKARRAENNSTHNSNDLSRSLECNDSIIPKHYRLIQKIENLNIVVTLAIRYKMSYTSKQQDGTHRLKKGKNPKQKIT